jgi:cell division protein FtsL
MSAEAERLLPGAADARSAPQPIRRRSRSLIRRRPLTRMAPLSALAIVCVTAVVFGVLLEQVILAQSAFELTRIRQRIAAAQAENQELLLQMTELQSPDRLERFAREELGMVDPSRVEYVVADVGAADPGVAVLAPSRGLRASSPATAAAALEGGP